MWVRLAVVPVTLGVGGVRVPGGLRRLQSGWNGRSPFGGFDSRPPPPTPQALHACARIGRSAATDPVQLRQRIKQCAATDQTARRSRAPVSDDG